jgi:hypothetical protein
MSNELQGAINVLVGKVDQKTQELTEMKRMINGLCREADLPVKYSDADLVVKGSGAIPSLDSDEFYGKAPTVAARMYLEKRDKAVPLDEILTALETGGFDFENQGWPEDQRLRQLGASMGKNSQIFHRLPNDTWGLLKWYPEVEKRKRPAKTNGKQSAMTEESESDAGEQTKTANAE